MFKTFVTGALALLVSMLGVVFLAGPASAAPPADCPNYEVTTETDTSLSASPSRPDVGETFTATATVEVDGAPVTGGTVEFKYSGRTKSAPVVAGEASVTFTAQRGSRLLTAVYTGQCLAEQIAIGTSMDRVAIIAGVEARSGGGGDNAGGGANRPPVGGGPAAVGGLGDTGFGSGTQLLGLLGLGLVAAGAVTIVARRRLG